VHGLMYACWNLDPFHWGKGFQGGCFGVRACCRVAAYLASIREGTNWWTPELAGNRCACQFGLVNLRSF